MRKTKFSVILILGMFLLSGYVALNATRRTLGAVGKVTFVTAKTAGKIAYKTAKLTGKGVKAVVNMATGKEIVKLEERANTFYVDAVLNERLRARLILDTGCSSTQISSDIAKKLGIKTRGADTVLCQLADGRTVSGRTVNIREIRLGRARVRNVKAIVLDHENGTGLLGMSFLDNFIFKVDTERKELVLQRRSDR